MGRRDRLSRYFPWIPAFAGMTRVGSGPGPKATSSQVRHPKARHPGLDPGSTNRCPTWISAFAGMTCCRGIPWIPAFAGMTAGQPQARHPGPDPGSTNRCLTWNPVFADMTSLRNGPSMQKGFFFLQKSCYYGPVTGGVTRATKLGEVPEYRHRVRNAPTSVHTPLPRKGQVC